MSDLSDIFKFEAFNLKGIAKKLKDHPERVLMGSFDPISTKVWNKALGRDDEPIIDQWGGASHDTYDKAEAAGIDTKAGHNMHRAARTIASMFALNAGGRSAGAGVDGGVGELPSFPGMGQQQPQQDIVKPLEVEFDADGNPMIVSSRAKKRPGTETPARELVLRGLRGDNPIDALGVRTGLIKEAGDELDAIEAQLDRLLGGK